MSKKELSGFYLVLATAFISGFSIFINKFGIKDINPYVFTGTKNFLVAIFLFVFLLARGELKSLKKLKTKDWISLIFIGLLGGSLPFLLFFKGLLLTSAAQASFVHKNMFLLVAPLAVIFLKEKLNKNFLIAALLLLSGNFLFFKLTSFCFSQGDLLIFLATAFWAVESLISKKILKSLPSPTVAFGRMFFGFILIGLFLAITGQISVVSQLSFKQISWIVFTSFLLLGYVTTWYAGLKLIRVSLAVSILTLGAPTTAFLAALFLNSSYSASQIIGTLFLIFGSVSFLGFKKLISFLAKRKKFLHVRT